jgi:hypothetical protein
MPDLASLPGTKPRFSQSFGGFTGFGQHDDFGLRSQEPGPGSLVLDKRDLRKPENGFLAVLDALNRGQYLTANSARALFNTEDLDPVGALSGSRKSSFEDVADDLGFTGVPKKALGFFGNVVLDAGNLVGLGAATKAMKAALTAQKYGVKNLADLAELAKVNKSVANELQVAINSKIDIFRPIGKTLEAQGELGQRALVTVAGQPVPYVDVLTKPAMKFLTRTGQKFRGTNFGKFTSKIFSTGTGDEAFDDLTRSSMRLRRAAKLAAWEANAPFMEMASRFTPDDHKMFSHLLQVKGQRANEELVRFLTGKGVSIVRKKGIPMRLGANIMQSVPLTRPEAEKYIKSAREMTEFLLQKDLAEGLDIQDLGDVVEYLPQKLTEKGQGLVGRAMGFPEDIRKWNMSHTAAMHRQFRGMTSVQWNDLAKREGVHINGRPTGKLDFDLFETDVPSLLAQRYYQTTSAMVSRSYLREAADNFGLPFEKSPTDWVKVDNPYLEGFAFPPEKAEVIDELFNKGMGDEDMNNAWGFIKAVNSLWRTTTLALFPATWGRDLLSNTWTYGISGHMNNPGALAKGFKISSDIFLDRVEYGRIGRDLFNTAELKGLGKDVVARHIDTQQPLYYGGRILNGDHIVELSKKLGVTGSAFAEQLERAKFTTAYVNGKAKKVLREANPFSQNFLPYKGGMAIREHVVDDPYRLGMFIDGLERGMDPEAAAAEVRKWYYDWFDLTKAERNVLREVFPFYAWLRKNLPRQLEMLTETQSIFGMPVRGAVIPLKVKQSVERDQMISDPRFVPQWIKDGTPIQIRRDPVTGKTSYMILNGWHPSADIARIFDPRGLFVGQLNPFLREAMSQVANFDLNYKRKLERFPGEMVEFFGMPMQGRVTHALRNIRILNEADRMIFGKHLPPEVRLRGVVPTSARSVDIEAEASKRLREIEQELAFGTGESRRAMAFYKKGIRPEASMKNLELLERKAMELRTERDAIVSGTR